MPEKKIIENEVSEQINPRVSFFKKNQKFIVVAVIVLAVAVAFVFLQFGTKDIKTPGSPSTSKIEPAASPEEARQRVDVMNILNTFTKQASVGVSRPPTADQKVRLEQSIDQVLAGLQQIQGTDNINDAQAQLSGLFSKWREALKDNKTDETLKERFAAVAAKFPWLDTLLWIIIYNNL